MIIKKYLIVCFLFFVTISLFSYSFVQKKPIPEYYGFYIVANGELKELENVQEAGYTIPKQGKGTELNYSGFNVNDPNLYFILYEKDLGFLSGELELNKLQLVKMYLQWNISDSYSNPPKTVRELNKWVVTNTKFKLRRKPVEKREDMVILALKAPLEPGVYAISLGDAYCVFSVNIESYDQDSEALDRITPPGWEGWSRDIYVPHGKYGVSSTIRSRSSRPSGKPSRVSLHAAQRRGMEYIEKANYPLAEEQFRKALDMKGTGYRTDHAKSHFGLGLALAYQHKFDEALKSFKTSIRMVPNLSDAYYSIACIYALRGYKDSAFNYLEKALEKGFKDYEFIKNDSDLDNLRDDPRFEILLSKKK